MASTREALYLLTLFICCYSVNYFEPNKKLLTALLSLIFILPRLACFYASGKGYENFAFAINTLVSIGGLIAWKVLIVQGIGHSAVSLVVVVMARLMLVVLQWCGPKKGRIDWWFVLLAAMHGLLVSDLTRMVSFFSVVPTAYETMICVLLFAFILAGNALGMIGRKRFLRTRLAYAFLLLSCYGIAVDRVRIFRHSYQADRYLSTKDNILAMLMLRRKFNGHVEFEQLSATSQPFRHNAVVKFMWQLVKDNRWTANVEELFRMAIGHTYPVLLDADVIRRILKVRPGDLEQSTMFNMPAFAVYASRKAEKKLMKAQAWALASSYYSAVQWLLLVSVILGLACCAWNDILEVPFWWLMGYLAKSRAFMYLKGKWKAFCSVMTKTFYDTVIEEEQGSVKVEDEADLLKQKTQ